MTPTAIDKLNNYFSRFIKIGEKEQAIIASLFTERRYLKGHYLLQNGDLCRKVSFVTSGATKTFYVDDSGKEHIIMFGVEDWWVADLSSFITQTPSDFNVQCIERTEVLQLSFEGRKQLFQEIPEMERFFRIITEKAYVATQKRIIANYSKSAKERYIEFCESYPSIANRVPQYMIASYLGISKEFLSKIRNQMSQ
ncbi:MAG: Crp/Fnr family transcriptional regulator [Bacteroidota bacterium]